MARLWVLVFLLGLTNSLKHVEQREIKTSDGKIFNCFYTINYNGKGVVNKKKSTVSCDPDKNGGTAIEVFDLPKVGKISLKHSVKKGKEAVQDFSPYSSPTSSVAPMNCSCMVPFPKDMMETMGSGMPTMAGGRRLAPMLMSQDGENNRKIMRVDRGLNRIGPILLLLLLPQIIAAIQAALAGRSLAVDQEELAAKFNRQLFGNGGANPADVLGSLTGGGLLGGLTGGLTGGTGGGNPAELIGLLTSLINGELNLVELLSNPLVQQLIQQVVQQQLQEFMDNGGPEQVIGEMMAMSENEMMAMIMPFIPEDAQAVVQQFAQMTDEEFMQHVMDQMGMSGDFGEMLGGGFNMTDIIQELGAPFDVYCDCIPTEMEHGTMTRGKD